MPTTPRKDGIKPKVSIEALQKIAVDLENEKKSLEETNRALGNELSEVKRKLVEGKNQQQIPANVQQSIMNFRDDVEYYTRRLEEANRSLLKCLAENGLEEVDIQVVVTGKEK